MSASAASSSPSLPKFVLSLSGIKSNYHRGKITEPHAKLLDQAHEAAEAWHRELAKTGATFDQIIRKELPESDSLRTLGGRIVEHITAFQKLEHVINPAHRMRELVDSGWYLTALAIYFHYTPQALYNNADSETEHDGWKRTILHSAVSPNCGTVSVPFIRTVVAIDQRETLGLMKRTDSQGNLPVHSACRTIHPTDDRTITAYTEILPILFENEANRESVNALNRATFFGESCSAIYFVAEIKPLIALLQSYGADINLQNADGNTALHLLALEKNPRSDIAPLLESGADPKIRNKQGHTPFFLCFQTLMREAPQRAFSQLSQARCAVLLANLRLLLKYGADFDIPFEGLEYFDPTHQDHGHIKWKSEFAAQLREYFKPFLDQIDWTVTDEHGNSYLHHLDLLSSEYFVWMVEHHPQALKQQLFIKNDQGKLPRLGILEAEGLPGKELLNNKRALHETLRSLGGRGLEPAMLVNNLEVIANQMKVLGDFIDAAHTALVDPTPQEGASSVAIQEEPDSLALLPVAAPVAAAAFQDIPPSPWEQILEVVRSFFARLIQFFTSCFGFAS